MNQMKSCIYFGGVKEEVKAEILHITGMGQVQLSFRYLGVPLSSQKLTVMQCMPLIKKILARIECWASRLLSYAGRVQLIKSVLFGIQVYWSQVFLIPHKVMKVIQTACRTFLWTEKSSFSRRALVAWDKISVPKSAGGLGIVNLSLWNKAALCKMFWNLVQKKDRTWIRWVHGLYIKERNLLDMQIPIQCSWVVKKIMGAREYIREVSEGQEWLTKPKFSIGNMYKALRGEVQCVSWHRMLCNNAAPPKCIFINWLLMHDSLPTYEHLRKIGLSVAQTCCFCENDVETLDHLFFGCGITGEIWTHVTGWCGMKRVRRDWHHEKIFMISQCRSNIGKQVLSRSVFAVVVYLVWKERNMRRMQGVRAGIESIIHKCKILVAWCGHRNRKVGKIMEEVS